MKKYYISPSLELLQTIATEHICVYGPGSLPGEPGGLPAAQRMAALGNTTVKSNLGTLGSTGSIRSIGTLK